MIQQRCCFTVDPTIACWQNAEQLSTLEGQLCHLGHPHPIPPSLPQARQRRSLDEKKYFSTAANHRYFATGRALAGQDESRALHQALALSSTVVFVALFRLHHDAAMETGMVELREIINLKWGFDGAGYRPERRKEC